jgi:predicted Fe-S protein YdhL (DUF1289 family)
MSSEPRDPQPQTPVTPCIGICRMDEYGLCVGCRRTLAEIARWGSMDDEERLRWIAEVQPTRQPTRP